MEVAKQLYKTSGPKITLDEQRTYYKCYGKSLQLLISYVLYLHSTKLNTKERGPLDIIWRCQREIAILLNIQNIIGTLKNVK